MDFRTASIAGAIALTFSTSSFALDLQPYTTKGAPVGKTVFSLGHQKVDSNQANVDGTSVRLTHYFDLGGRRAVVDAKQFYLDIEGKGTLNDASGPSSFALGGGVYLIDDKAKGDYLLAGMFVATPTGQFHNSRLVNPGSNRYTYIPKIAYHTALTDKIDVAVSADVTFYSDSKNHFSTNTQKKDEMYNAQASFMYAVDPSLNLNTSIFYHEGGDVTVPQASRTENTQASVGFRKITDVGAFSVGYKKDINHVSGTELNSQWDFKWKIAW